MPMDLIARRKRKNERIEKEKEMEYTVCSYGRKRGGGKELIRAVGRLINNCKVAFYTRSHNGRCSNRIFEAG